MKNRSHNTAKTEISIYINPANRQNVRNKHNSARDKKLTLLILLAGFVLLWFFHMNMDLLENLDNKKLDMYFPFLENNSFLIHTPQCRIRNLHPFNEDVKRYVQPQSYQSCSKLPLLTNITKRGNKAILQVREEIVRFYSRYGVKCCYAIIRRSASVRDADLGFYVSDCKDFVTAVTLTIGAVQVTCRSKRNGKVVYKNTHVATLITREIKNKTRRTASAGLSVLILGIESMSRLNFIRTLTKTYRYVKENEWIEIKGYNTVGDDAFSTMMAILTGMNESVIKSTCKPTKPVQLEQCNYIMYKYHNEGYVTAFAEDNSIYKIFNFKGNGFKYPSIIDYHFRPYILASKQLKTRSSPYCLGPETGGERIINIALDFTKTFHDYSNLGLFWLSSFSCYDDLSIPSKMDEKLQRFLYKLEESDALNSTFVVFLSNRGNQKFSYTQNGWLEERLPFLFLFLPRWFYKNYPKQSAILKANTDKLTSVYDLYMTLQDILVLSGKQTFVKPASACPLCKSLFEEIETERSCQDAGVAQHWCACNNLKEINPKNYLAQEAALSVIKEIEARGHINKNRTKKCKQFELRRIISADISEMVHQWDNFIVINFETTLNVTFEATVELVPTPNGFKYNVKIIKRLDLYENYGNCVDNANLKPYCYCDTIS